METSSSSSVGGRVDAVQGGHFYEFNVFEIKRDEVVSLGSSKSGTTTVNIPPSYAKGSSTATVERDDLPGGLFCGGRRAFCSQYQGFCPRMLFPFALACSYLPIRPI